jgi:hypothetical protein
MGINLAGAAAGYQGFREDQLQRADESRKVEDHAFQQDQRGRARKDWAKADRIENARDADIADINKSFNDQASIATTSAAPGQAMQADANQSPAESKRLLYGTGGANQEPATQGVASKIVSPGGIPKPRSFNDALSKQAELLNRQLARGDVDPTVYAQTMKTIDSYKKEGVNDALEHFARGDYQGGVDKFNSIGELNKTKVVGGREGVTKINGVDTPTHFVDLIGTDGQRVTMDVAKARYQLMDMHTQMQHQDKSANTAMVAKHYADSNQLGKDQLKQQGEHQKSLLAMQGAHLALQRQQFDANTPFGQIASKEKALGRTLEPDEKATLLGIDNIPPVTKLQMNSLFKEQDQLSQAMNKAQADGTWVAQDKDGKQNPLLARSAILNRQLSDLAKSIKKTGAGSVVPPPLNLDIGGGAPQATKPINQAPTQSAPISAIKPALGLPTRGSVASETLDRLVGSGSTSQSSLHRVIDSHPNADVVLAAKDRLKKQILLDSAEEAQRKAPINPALIDSSQIGLDGLPYGRF